MDCGTPFSAVLALDLPGVMINEAKERSEGA
jgi:hypothetical protein